MKYSVEKSVVINGEEYFYTVEYKKQKNIYFRVKDGVIRVSCPKSVSITYIENLLVKNEKSIKRLFDTSLRRENASKELLYLGDKLSFIEFNGKPYIENSCIYAKSQDDAKEYIYSLALDVFNSRLVQVMHSFDNLPKFRLRVRKMKTKWGVCNTKSMTVTLNTELITKDVNLIDYVIVHELSHFSHMDHSKEFWLEVSKHYPYYKKARKELNY